MASAIRWAGDGVTFVGRLPTGPFATVRSGPASMAGHGLNSSGWAGRGRQAAIYGNVWMATPGMPAVKRRRSSGSPVSTRL